MTEKQIRTLGTLDTISNILATIQIVITILFVKYVRNTDMQTLFIFLAGICFIIVLKSILAKKKH